VLIHDLVLLLLPLGIALQLRERGPSWLPYCVGALYILAIAGFVLAEAIHVQLIIAAMGLLAVWMSMTLMSPAEGLRAAA
jgi:CBS-domain-containing membrane protein